MPTFLRLTILVVAASLLLTAAPAAVPASDGSDPTATAARKCGPRNFSESQSFGTTYVHWIRTRNVGCRKARQVVRAFHACRPGKTGRCGRRVEGFRCSENRFANSRYQYDSRVTCKRGGKRVRHAYTQNK